MKKLLAMALLAMVCATPAFAGIFHHHHKTSYRADSHPNVHPHYPHQRGHHHRLPHQHHPKHLHHHQHA